MNDLVKTDTQEMAILQVIERVATSPDADIEKLEKMLDMQERIMDKQAEAEFNKAMVAAISEIPSFEESTAGHHFKYATFEQINKIVKPILASHDLFMTFTTNFKDNGVYVTAAITHRAGYSRQTTGLFPFDTSGSKNDIQAVGSAISYGKRYMQNALLNITTHGEDDDGFASQKGISLEQIDKVNRGIITADIKPEQLCEYMGIEKISEIKAIDFSKAVQYLHSIIDAKAEK